MGRPGAPPGHDLISRRPGVEDEACCSLLPAERSRCSTPKLTRNKLMHFKWTLYSIGQCTLPMRQGTCARLQQYCCGGFPRRTSSDPPNTFYGTRPPRGIPGVHPPTFCVVGHSLETRSDAFCSGRCEVFWSNVGGEARLVCWLGCELPAVVALQDSTALVIEAIKRNPVGAIWEGGALNRKLERKAGVLWCAHAVFE